MTDFNPTLIAHTEQLLASQREKSGLRGVADNTVIPNRKEVIRLIHDLQATLFPAYFRHEETPVTLADLLTRLAKQIETALAFAGREGKATEIAEAFAARMPDIQNLLHKDIEALYEGDPAAISHEEVLLCYPGFYAISIFRFAHELYVLGVPYLARMMTEFAHEKTGIDIHAGATIGEYFFIDHGTGIVVGETTTIGNHVKLYQGVTLGAKSFELDADGNPVKGTKRHPDIGDHVIIYANATILGGTTSIGARCIIGGNVWLTHSVPADQRIS